MTPTNPISEVLKEFEEKYHDNGDERYGLAKHNNTILQNQIDWLQEKLSQVIQEAYERGIRETAIPVNEEFAKALNDDAEKLLAPIREALKEEGRNEEREAIKEIIQKQIWTKDEIGRHQALVNYNQALTDLLSKL